MGDTRARPALVLGLTLLFLVGGGAGAAAPSARPSARPSAHLSDQSRVLAAHDSTAHRHTNRHPNRHPKKSAHDQHRRGPHHHRHHHRHQMKKTTSATSTATTARWSGSVDTTSKGAVNAAYLRDFASGLQLPTGWTGNESRCLVGTQAPSSRAATLRALNFARSMAGLAPVVFSSDLNARSQQSALMMSANRALSHTPPRSWRCYTATGAANAARSNLVLSYPSITSAGLVSLYLADPGSTNMAAGHRRWLLNPFATTMGSGATTTANAITVVGPTASSRPNPDIVAWPTAGWFPSPLEPTGRWSLSLGNRALSLRWATVRVWRNGTLISATRNPVQDGYAQPTLVWQLPASQARSGTFRVEVRSIRATAKGPAYTRSYTVRMFTPGG